MNAYPETYLEDAAEELGIMFDYAVNDCKYSGDLFLKMFASGVVGEQFGKGNPKYVAGMSGIELGLDTMRLVANDNSNVKETVRTNRTREYWTGWALGHIQWHSGLSFSNLYKKGIDYDKVYDCYILHEAGVQKLYDWADKILWEKSDNEESTLKRLRAYWKYTQRELSEKSGVPLRMIQLYEQGRNDIHKASVQTVSALADALRCEVDDLLC